MDNFDTIVIGGGPSGAAAAAAAARRGSKTLLIEKTLSLGGMGTNGMVNTWAPFSDGISILYKGIAEEVFTGVKARMPHVPSAAVDWVPISAEDLKCVYDSLVLKSGVHMLFNVTLCGADMNGGEIEAITVFDGTSFKKLHATHYIDCTGNALLAHYAGAPCQKGDDNGGLQAATLCFAIANVDERYYHTTMLHTCYKDSIIFKIKESGKYPLVDAGHFIDHKIGPGTVGFNAGHLWDTDDEHPEEITKSMLKGREIANETYRALKEFFPEAFGNSYLVSTAPVLGIRESRRIVGEYVLTAEDYTARRKFDDDIAENCYYLDVHPGKNKNVTKIENAAYAPGESHGIPYRSLLPRKVGNLIVAGRAISCDKYVFGSIRVMPTCLVTGEAAGAACALAQLYGVPLRGIDINTLQSWLPSVNGSKGKTE